MSENPPLHKYAEIERLGHEENYGILSVPEDVVVIQEKIDGGNAQFRLWEREIIFGTRNNHFRIGDTGSPQTKQFGANASWVIDEMSKQFNAGNEWANVLNPDFIYYGEWCKKHTINYDWEKMPAFIGFDIYNLMKHQYIPYEAVKLEYSRLGLPVVSLLFRGKIGEIDITRLENFVDHSNYYDGMMEGIVIKNYFRQNVYGRQLFAKIVRQEFKEANMGVFGMKPGKVHDDTVKFMETFYTEARIRKAIHRLIDEGGLKLERGLMHHLPRAVAEDVWKEETWTIMKAFDNINFGLLKKSAPKLCLRVLDALMTERAINEDQSNSA